MTGIYRPKGRAREYADWALNHYVGCDHHCSYCYNSPLCKDFHTIECRPRPGLTIDYLRNQLESGLGIAPGEYVLLSFQGDPYCHAEEIYGWTRRILNLFLEYQVPTAILTKGGKRCLRDIDLFKQFDTIKIGATLTFANLEDSKKYEPDATPPVERLLTLSKLKDARIRTWASFEPVIDPDQTIALMELSEDYADAYKIGKLNHNKELESLIDWRTFGERAEALCKEMDKPYYIKADLRKAMEVEHARLGVPLLDGVLHYRRNKRNV